MTHTPTSSGVSAEAEKAAHKALMSELFLVCQPNHGDVFSFMDDHPELMAVALKAALPTPPPRPSSDTIGGGELDAAGLATAKDAFDKAMESPRLIDCPTCAGSGSVHSDWCPRCAGGGVDLADGEETRPLSAAIRAYLFASPPEGRQDGGVAVTDAMVEAACLGYWPDHWPKHFAEADLASIRTHMRAALNAALAHSTHVEEETLAAVAVTDASGWQTMDSAPKGRLIDLWLVGDVRWCDCYYDQICDEWRTSRPSGRLISVKAAAVTHWREPPASPAALVPLPKPAEWRSDVESAPRDGTVIEAVGRYLDATAGFPRYVAFRDGAWFDCSRHIDEVIIWAWRPRTDWPQKLSDAAQPLPKPAIEALREAMQQAMDIYQADDERDIGEAMFMVLHTALTLQGGGKL